MKRRSFISFFLVAALLILSVPQLAFASTGLNLQFSNTNASTTSNSIYPKFKLTNTGDQDIDLSEVSMRYYYTADEDKEQSFWCDHSGMMDGWNYISVTSHVYGNFVKMPSAVEGADTYLEVGFDNGAGVLRAGSSIEVQTRFARNDWTNYNQANDYSYTTSSQYSDWDHVTAYIGGQLVSGTPPTGEVVVRNSEITPTAVTFDKNVEKQSDIDIFMTLNGNAFTGIKGLVKDVDYTVSGNKVTLNKEYLATLEKGTTTFTFDFSAGIDPKLTVNVIDTTVQQGSTIAPTTVTFDKNVEKQADVVVTMDLKGNTLEAIKNGDVTLVKGTDYVVDGNIVTISKAYLAAFEVGTVVLTFDFSAGEDATLTVNIIDTTISTTDFTVKIGSAEGKAGEMVTIPVSFLNVPEESILNCDFKLKYDTNVLEAVSVEPGEIVVNPAVNFGKNIKADIGSVNYLFLDETIGNELITQDGVFSYITFKIKDSVAAGTTTPIELRSVGAFGNKNLERITPTFESGTITITEGGQGGEEQDSVINPTSATFDKNVANQSDIEVDMTLNGNLLIGINNGSNGLVEDMDYTVTGNVYASPNGKVTLKKEYLANLEEGTTSLTFNFSGGVDPEFTVNVIDTTVNDSAIAPTTVTFDKNVEKQADAVVAMILNGNTLKAIKNGSTTLTAGTDYVVNGSTVTISKAYLATLEVGTVVLTFEFSAGANADLTVNVIDTTVFNKDFTVNIGSAEGKAGEMVTIPVSFANVPEESILNCDFKLKYDTNVLEAVSVEAGEIVVNPAVNFGKNIKADIGSINYLFLDETIGNELITQDGVFSYITFKIKDSAAAGTTPVELRSVGAFGNKNLQRITPVFESGTITITEGGQGGEEQDSVINPTSATFDKNIANQSDIEVAMTLNGNVFIGINDLVEDIEYTVSDNTVTISKEYLATLNKGTTTLTFNFSGGVDPEFTVNVIDTTVNDSAIAPTAVTFDKNVEKQADAVVAMILNGNTLNGIKNGSTTLAKGTDYVVNGSTVTISKAYLATLEVGTEVLTFGFSAGASADLTVNVIDTTVVNKDFTVNIGSVEGKAGEMVTIPVSFVNVPEESILNCDFKLQYDTNVLEAVSVEAGDIVVNPGVNFSKNIKADIGSINYLFLDETIGDQLITQDGVFSYITFKIKDSAAAGTTPIELRSVGAFGNKNLQRITSVFEEGSIVITQ